MKKTNNLNKKTQEWIKNQLCYYHENYDIAEGYCDRGAEVILEGRYLCWKCVALKRKHKILSFLKFILLFVFFLGGIIMMWFSSLPLLGFFIIGFSFIFLITAMSDIVFKHKGIVGSWNGFVCRHCPKKFLDEDKKLFANHLKTEHPNEWSKIEEEIQQFPNNNNKILKIEMPEILRKHKKGL